MLNDKQSLLLCGVLIGIYFVSGVLDILDNYAIKTILALIFFAVVGNLVYVNSKTHKQKDSHDNS
ncbi:hypothetical protein [Aestuariibaculum suncheonense]|uniref:Uncharacterized protein n=1 Tax=Aestuariibaculum suncheonense TaxID=1028745 RepID=A0A8J6QBP5_9FLAO|nr:hypothetical protein [Aestuariibaculum suncheonense]MBD0834693.1 hypothetical protein [Aestuariibaculum suncheonense]